MKSKLHAVRLAAMGAVLGSITPHAAGQTLNWGSEVFSDIVDSHGQALDESTFLFQLGTFEAGFIPTSENTHEWSARWHVFDQAAYNESLGYFTSSVLMNDDGTSSYNPGAVSSFEGQAAYLWIFNSPDLGTTTEWFLGTAPSWVFPDAEPGCCDNESVVQWSVSDLDGPDTPVWGSQSGIAGDGYYTVTGGYTLQTFTIIPEPSTSLLAMCSSLALLVHRRRKS